MLAHRMSRVESSGVRRIFERMASIVDPTKLSLGQPRYEPPPAWVEAACRALCAGFHRYTVTQGLPLRNARILDAVQLRHGRREEVSLVTSGDWGRIVLAFFALLDLVVPGKPISTRDTHFWLSFAAEDATLKRDMKVLNESARGE